MTHTTAANIELLIRFYRLTGETKFLARIPEAIEWLDGLKLPPGVAPNGRTHPTFVELGTNQPLYVHREGSNVVNGRYFVDHDPKNTVAHYSSFRRIDIAGLRKTYAEAKALSPAAAIAGSPLAPGGRLVSLPRFFAASAQDASMSVASVIGALNEQGYWPAPLGTNSHPYRGPGSAQPVRGDFSQTHVGDESDTSPYPDDKITGISTAAYIRNMSVLIRSLSPR